MSSEWMIYGANGYTGELVAREATRRGERPILAGRGEAVETLAAELGLTAIRCGLDDHTALVAAIKRAGVGVVLHCAGPFSATSRPMVEACLEAGVHYLDITGEISVFEALAARDRDDRARQRGVMLMPGVGFDVVPTDCLAAHLHRRLPTADRLVLGLRTRGGVSRGTATTAIEGLGKGGAIRRDGKIIEVPMGSFAREIDFGDGPTWTVAIPWGDVSTAYHSTGIPNIEVYLSMPPMLRRLATLSRYFGPLLSSKPAQRFLRARIRKGAAGPTAEQRARGRVVLWGEASDASGRAVSSRLETPEGYAFTVDAALTIATRVARGEARPGFQTPSRVIGADFVLELAGVQRIDL